MSNPQLELFIAPSCASASGLIVGQVQDQFGVAANLNAYNILRAQSIGITAASGYSSISISGQVIPTFTIGSDPSTLQTALNSLSVIGPTGSTVMGMYPYQVQFNKIINYPLFNVGTTNLSATGFVPTTASGTSLASSFDTNALNFSSIGTWVNGGSSAGASLKTNATGTGLQQAKWKTTGVLPGCYQFYYSNDNNPGSGVSQSTPFRFLDGTTPRTLLSVNEQTSINTVSPPATVGSFQPLATVPINSGTAIVLVTDQVQPADIGNQVRVNQLYFAPINPFANVILTFTLNPSFVAHSGSWNFYSPGSCGWNGVEYFTTQIGATTTWYFPGLMQNCIYSLQYQYCIGDPGSRSTMAQYQIYDGNTLLQTITINQQTIIAGGVTLTDNVSVSHPFGVLGSFQTKTCTLTVVLTAGSDTVSLATVSNVMLCFLQTAEPYIEPVTSNVIVTNSGPPSVQVVSGPTITLGTPIFEPGNPTIYWPIVFPAPLTPASQLLFSGSQNCFNTSAGLVPAITNQSLINRVGSRISDATPAHKTMGVGYNLYKLGYDLPLYSNQVYNCVSITYNGSISPQPFLNSNGFPKSAVFDRWYFSFGNLPTNPVDARGYPAWPLNGPSTVIYDGAVGAYINLSPAGGVLSRIISLNTGHATGNMIQVEFTLSGINSPNAPVFNMPISLLDDYCDDLDSNRFTPATGSTRHTDGGWNGAYYTCPTTAVATFHLGNQYAATYNLALSYPVSGGNSASVTVTVKESGSQILTFNINQQFVLSQSSAADYNAASHLFTLQNAYTCTGGPITVEVHGDGSGNCVSDCVWSIISGTLTSGVPVVPVTKWDLYRPGVDYTNPPEFDKIFTDSLGPNPKSLRSMQIMGANDGAMIDYADYAQPGQLCYGAGSAQLGLYNLIKVSNPPATAPYFQDTKAPVLFTVSPVNGSKIPVVTGTPFALPGGLDVTWTTGGVAPFSGYFSSVYHDPATMDANQFVMATGFGGDISGTVNEIDPTPPATSLGLCGCNYNSITWPSYFRLVASFPNCGAHINVTHIASQACVTQIMHDALTWLPPDRTIRFEVSNEPWNNAYAQFQYFFGIAQTSGLGDPQMGYALVASTKHGWATTALGSRANKLIRVFNCAYSSSSTASSVFAYCNANGQLVDEIHIAPYLAAQPRDETGLLPTPASLNTFQLNDCADAWLKLGNNFIPTFQVYNGLCQAQTIATGRQCNLGGYEGGTASNWMGGNSTVQLAQTVSSRYDPQAGVVNTGLLSVLQNNGFVIEHIYNLDQVAGGDFAANVYGYVVGWFNPPGDGSTNVANIAGVPPGPPNFVGNTSPLAYSVNQWNGPPQAIGPLMLNMRRRFTS